MTQQSGQRIIERVLQPIASATGLPNSCYVDQQSFVSDRDLVLGKTWASLAFVDELETQNYALPVDFMGLPLLLTRDRDDNIRVFHNVCSHRGMLLADKPCANKSTVRCPYHSWTYRLDGQLHGTPHIGGYGQHQHEDFDKSQHGLREVRSAVWLGSVFINLSGDAEPFEDYIAPVRDRWSSHFAPEVEWSAIRLSDDGSRMSLSVKSNWKLAIENYLESYHLPFVHPELNRISPLSEHYNVDEFVNGCGQGSLNYDRLEADGHRLTAMENWPEQRASHAEYPVLYPNTLLGIHVDQLFVMQVRPQAPDRSAEHVRIYYFGESASSDTLSAVRQKNLSGWREVFQEDVFAVERMQSGRHSPAYQGGVFSPSMDKPTHHFHKWVAQKLV